MGGTAALFGDNPNRNPMFASTRISEGKKAGYKDAAAILGNLSEGETIKLVTNSMGTAFARGFTQGILQYQTEENARRTTFNQGINKILTPLYEQQKSLEALKKDGENFMNKDDRKKLSNELAAINLKIQGLESSKKQMLDVRFEMEIDLSSHQIDYINGDVERNYYMSCEPENMRTEAFSGVKQKDIIKAKFIGTMERHHSSGADPDYFPSSSTPDPKPQHNVP